VQLAELAADHVHVVAEQRPLRVAGDLHGLPRAEILVGLAQQGGVVHPELAELLGVVDVLLRLKRLELVDLLLELGQRPLELQHVAQRLGGRRAVAAVHVAAAGAGGVVGGAGCRGAGEFG
jgi:hypothetical protein